MEARVLMPGRRVSARKSVAVVSLASTGDAATDRVMIPAEQSIQDLQDRGRSETKRLDTADTALGARIDSLTATVDALTGRFVARQVLTGSGTYTPTPGTTAARARLVGGGGGGGGGSGGAGVACGSGGGSGTYYEFTVVGGTVTGGAYSVGSGGSAGSSAGGTGGTGGNTTLVLNGTTYTAKGGTGGTGQTNTGSSHAPAVGHAQGGTPSTATTILVGEDGDHGVYAASDGYFWGGAGGGNPLGSGGGTVDGGNNGAVGFGLGGGGGGAAATTVGKSGAAGSAGIIIIEEYS